MSAVTKIKNFFRWGKISFPFWISLFTFIISLGAALGFFLFFQTGPMITQTALQTLIFYLSFLIPSVVVFATFVYKWRKEKNITWLLFAFVLPLVYSFLIGIGSYFITLLFAITFKYLYFDYVSGSILAAIYLTLVARFLVRHLLPFDVKRLLHLIAAFIITGFLVSAILNQDIVWWMGSICGLGMTVNGTANIFNFMLVFTGLLLLLLALLLRPMMNRLLELKIIDIKRTRVLKGIYFASVALVIIAGLLPYGSGAITNILHIYAGDSIFIIFAIMLGFSMQLFTNYPKRFYIKSFGILGLGLFLYSLYAFFRYYPITFFEIFALILIAVWFNKFLNTSYQIIENA